MPGPALASTQQTPLDTAAPAIILHWVLGKAIERVVCEAGAAPLNALPGKKGRTLGRIWRESLCSAFREIYRSRTHYEVRPEYNRSPPITTKVAQKEFMYDVCVVETERVASANDRPVKSVVRAVWLVESEVAQDSTAVAYDLSKLKIGRAAYKLLVVAYPKQLDVEKWLGFVIRASRGMSDIFFVALIPSYSERDPKAHEQWRTGALPPLLLYRRSGNGLELVASEPSPPAR